MIWYFLLGYVLFVEVFVIGSALIAWFSDSSEIQELTGGNRRSKAILFGITVLTAPFTFPILLPKIIAACRAENAAIDAENSYWEDIRHEFKPLSLEPLHEGNVDPQLREHFETQSECLERLGYEHLGEVWIKDSDPQWSKGKFWLSPDRTMLAQITVVFGTMSLEVVSFLEDGSVIDSANCQSAPNFTPMQAHNFFVRCDTDVEMDELVRNHAGFVGEIVERVGAKVREMDARSWKDYLRYETHRFAEVMNKIDGKTIVPDEIVFPQTNAARVEKTSVAETESVT